MISIIYDDLLNAKETYIVQQVNCIGVMGAGLALQIRQKYPSVYRRYCEYCETTKARKLLGKILLIPTEDGKVVCNVFGQLTIGTDRQQTDYAALSKAFSSLDRIIPKSESIAIPYMMGSGLGGGNWKIIESIISDIFKNRDVNIYRI